MTLTTKEKDAIIEECNKWKDEYGDMTMEERKKLGAFYTPGELIIEMIECLDNIDPDEDYEDPAAGNGNILAALMLCGVKPNHIYCNELDVSTLERCKKRLNDLAMKLYGETIPESHFRHADALTEEAYFLKEPTFMEKFGRVK